MAKKKKKTRYEKKYPDRNKAWTKKQWAEHERKNPRGYAGVRSYGVKEDFRIIGLKLEFRRYQPNRYAKEVESIKKEFGDEYHIRVVKHGKLYDVYRRKKGKILKDLTKKRK